MGPRKRDAKCPDLLHSIFINLLATFFMFLLAEDGVVPPQPQVCVAVVKNAFNVINHRKRCK